LHRVGLDGLAVETAAAYVEAAARLAGDLDRLVMLRARLRQTMADSPLCDAPAFARDVEDAYRRLWRDWCAARP
jgi:predicted O-linked N-acetylglucosamine transferase (SPINDLY family)